jgi:hypothetical protein
MPCGATQLSRAVYAQCRLPASTCIRHRVSLEHARKDESDADERARRGPAGIADSAHRCALSSGRHRPRSARVLLSDASQPTSNRQSDLRLRQLVRKPAPPSYPRSRRLRLPLTRSMCAAAPKASGGFIHWQSRYGVAPTIVRSPPSAASPAHTARPPESKGKDQHQVSPRLAAESVRAQDTANASNNEGKHGTAESALSKPKPTEKSKEKEQEKEQASNMSGPGVTFVPTQPPVVDDPTMPVNGAPPGMWPIDYVQVRTDTHDASLFGHSAASLPLSRSTAAPGRRPSSRPSSRRSSRPKGTRSQAVGAAVCWSTATFGACSAYTHLRKPVVSRQRRLNTYDRPSSAHHLLLERKSRTLPARASGGRQ